MNYLRLSGERIWLEHTGRMERLAAAALVILLASAYSQHSAHERLVGALGTRIALLEKQADDARAQDAHERVLLRGALEKLTVTLEGQAAQVNAREWVNETASAIMTEMEHHADVRAPPARALDAIRTLDAARKRAVRLQAGPSSGFHFCAGL